MINDKDHHFRKVGNKIFYGCEVIFKEYTLVPCIQHLFES